MSVDLPTLLMIIAIVVLWLRQSSLQERILDLEAVQDDHDDEFEHLWGHTNEQFSSINSLFSGVEEEFSDIQDEFSAISAYLDDKLGDSE
jgi:hypothetical protein